MAYSKKKKDEFSKITGRFDSKDRNKNFNAFLERAEEIGFEVDMNSIRSFDQYIGLKGNGFWISPENVASFISKITSFRNPKSILDPACGSASLFSAISPLLNSNSDYMGIDIDSEVLKIAKLNLSNKNLINELLEGDFFLIKDNINKKFDLIISQPPFGKIMNSRKKIHELNVRDVEIAFLLASLDLLESNGNLIFVIPESFFYSHYYKKIRSYLLANFSIEAIISLPSKTFFPYTGIKTNILIIKNSIQRNKIFFAEYNDHDEDIIIKNYIDGDSNNNLSQGFWVNSDLLSKEQGLWTFNFLKALVDFKSKKNNSKYELKQLSEIIEPINDNLGENDEVILIPKFLNKEIIFSNEIENERHFKNYYKFKIVEKNILPQYLKIYLNSQIGKNQRNLISSDNTSKIINRRALDYIYIEIPNLRTQTDIINTSQSSSEVYNKIKLLHDNFNNQVFNYSEIFEIMNALKDKINEKKEEEFFYRNLIWPYATSYHIATKGSIEPNKKLDNYFNLFELISAFNAIVLLSSLPEELYEEEKDYIWNTKDPSYKKISFGKWIGLYSRLIGTYRKMTIYYKNKKEDFYDFLPFDQVFYYPLLNIKIIKILNKVVEKRNNDAHGGSIPDVLAENIISELNEHLNEIFPVLTTYSSLKLIYTEGMDKNRGIYKINSKILEGNSYSFDAHQIETDIDMDTKVLYLYNPITDDRLMLYPELVNLIQCVECGNWSLYFYNSINESNAKYISYQYEIHEHNDSREALGKFLDIIDFKNKDISN